VLAAQPPVFHDYPRCILPDDPANWNADRDILIAAAPVTDDNRQPRHNEQRLRAEPPAVIPDNQQRELPATRAANDAQQRLLPARPAVVLDNQPQRNQQRVYPAVLAASNDNQQRLLPARPAVVPDNQRRGLPAAPAADDA